MNNDKFETRSKNSGKKAVAMLLVLVLLLGAVVGTTLAWLIDNTAPVVNTFTVGNIDIELKELNADANNKQTFPVIPGATVTKAADVIVKSGSEACWLFVEITEANDTNNWLNWEAASPWAKVDGEDNVYFIVVDKVTGQNDVSYDVLKEDKVTVSGAMTKEYADKVAAGTVEEPTLTFTAYAVQSQYLTDLAGAIPTTGEAAELAKYAARAWDLRNS